MKRWYVVQVYTGYEEAVKHDLEKRIVAEGASDLFGDVLVPTGGLASLAVDDEEREKILPGYVLIQMEMVPEAFQVVRAVPRVAKFLGGDNPVPLGEHEVDRIRNQMSGKIEVAPKKVPFTIGSEVHVGSGPFSGFVGIIDTIDEERGKLTVMVSIFGRHTPIELGFDQVHE